MKLNYSYMYGFDTEFNPNNYDVHSIQLYGLDNEKLMFYDGEDFSKWMFKNRPEILVGFNLLCDLGSLQSLDIPVYIYERGNQIRGRLAYSQSKNNPSSTLFVDLKSISNNMNFKSLAKIGKFLELLKLEKPSFLGKRLWEGEREQRIFEDYAMRDSEITYLYGKYLEDTYNVKLSRIFSGGTIAKIVLKMEKRNIRDNDGYYHFANKFEHKLQDWIFAGRNECMINGYNENIYYNDIKAQYAVSALITEAFKIIGAIPCELSDLDLSNDLFNIDNFGWIEGYFTCNSEWGMPIKRDGRNYYITTNEPIYGIYHTYDIIASDMKIHDIISCWRVIKSDNYTHKKYAQIYNERLLTKDKYKNAELKLILNSATGKLGQKKPVLASHTNFFAYTTVLAYAHMMLKKLADKTRTVIGCDTDSIFSDDNLSMELANVNGYSISSDLKGYGDLVYFRSKLYCYTDRKHYAGHAIKYNHDNFFQTILSRELGKLQFQKTHTFKARDSQVQNMPFGYWMKQSETPNYEMLLKADTKRQRENYDSLALYIDRESSISQTYSASNIKEQIAKTQHIWKFWLEGNERQYYDKHKERKIKDYKGEGWQRKKIIEKYFDGDESLYDPSLDADENSPEEQWKWQRAMQ